MAIKIKYTEFKSNAIHTIKSNGRTLVIKNICFYYSVWNYMRFLRGEYIPFSIFIMDYFDMLFSNKDYYNKNVNEDYTEVDMMVDYSNDDKIRFSELFNIIINDICVKYRICICIFYPSQIVPKLLCPSSIDKPEFVAKIFGEQFCDNCFIKLENIHFTLLASPYNLDNHKDAKLCESIITSQDIINRVIERGIKFEEIKFEEINVKDDSADEFTTELVLLSLGINIYDDKFQTIQEKLLTIGIELSNEDICDYNITRAIFLSQGMSISDDCLKIMFDRFK